MHKRAAMKVNCTVSFSDLLTALKLKLMIFLTFLKLAIAQPGPLMIVIEFKTQGWKLEWPSEELEFSREYKNSGAPIVEQSVAGSLVLIASASHLLKHILWHTHLEDSQTLKARCTFQQIRDSTFYMIDDDLRIHTRVVGASIDLQYPD